MILILNSQGVLVDGNTSDYIMQGSDGVNELYVAYPDYDSATHTCKAVFTPNGGTALNYNLVLATFDFKGRTYNGFKVNGGLDSFITGSAGALSINVVLYDSNNSALVSYTFSKTVNATGISAWDSTINKAEYQNLVAQLLYLQSQSLIDIHNLHTTSSVPTSQTTPALSSYAVNSKVLVLDKDNPSAWKIYNATDSDSDNIVDTMTELELFPHKIVYLGSIASIQSAISSITNADVLYKFKVSSVYYYAFINYQNGSTKNVTVLGDGNVVNYNSSGTLITRTLSTGPNNDLTLSHFYKTMPSADNELTSKSQLDTGLATKQDTLVSGTNIKNLKVDGVVNSLLGSGQIDIQTGGSPSWGNITGTLSNQTDLNNELQNIREVAIGKKSSYILSSEQTIINLKGVIGAMGGTFKVYKIDKTDITQNVLDGDYDEVVIKNSSFNTENNSVGFATMTDYLIIQSGNDIETFGGWAVVDTIPNFIEMVQKGDDFYITQTGVPDRWCSSTSSNLYLEFSKLEGGKTDLTNYVTQSALATALSTKANLTGGNTFTGDQTFNGNISIGASGDTYSLSVNGKSVLVSPTNPDTDGNYVFQRSIASGVASDGWSEKPEYQYLYTKSWFEREDAHDYIWGNYASNENFTTIPIHLGNYKPYSYNLWLNVIRKSNGKGFQLWYSPFAGQNTVGLTLLKGYNGNYYKGECMFQASDTHGFNIFYQPKFRGIDLATIEVPYGLTKIDNTITELSYEWTAQIELSANATFTLKTAPNQQSVTMQYKPTYKAIITTTTANITITLPSGTICKTDNATDCSISSNVLTLKNTSATYEISVTENRCMVRVW